MIPQPWPIKALRASFSIVVITSLVVGKGACQLYHQGKGSLTLLVKIRLT